MRWSCGEKEQGPRRRVKLMTDSQTAAIDRARKRVRQVQEFYAHLVIYVLVCTLLIVIDLATGSDGNTFLGLDWAFWPIAGWGIGVAFHGVSATLLNDN